MKKVWMMSAVAGILLMACNKDDDNNNSKQLNDSDRTFMTQASLSNTAEITVGQLAIAKSTNVNVKSYAQMMVADHQTAQTDLKTLGNNVGITVRDTLDPMHVTLMQRLNSLTGYSFDTAYMNSQLSDHQKTLLFFDTELNAGSHQQVKGYASTYRPKIQMHYNRADTVRRGL